MAHSKLFKYLNFLNKRFKWYDKKIKPNEAIECPICKHMLSQCKNIKAHVISNHGNFLEFLIEHLEIKDAYSNQKEALEVAASCIYIDLVHKNFDFSSETLDSFIVWSRRKLVPNYFTQVSESSSLIQRTKDKNDSEASSPIRDSNEGEIMVPNYFTHGSESSSLIQRIKDENYSEASSPIIDSNESEIMVPNYFTQGSESSSLIQRIKDENDSEASSPIINSNEGEIMVPNYFTQGSESSSLIQRTKDENDSEASSPIIDSIEDYKMDGEQLNLKWNNHKTTFFEMLKIQREKSNYTDATLAVEGKFYPVHKLVMSTCSEYFSHIFEITPCKSPVIVLKDVQSHDIEALLDYIYLGEVNVKQNNLSSLMKTAECLRIKGLAVTDEDSTRLSKNSTSSHDDPCWDSPSPKRRRYHSKSISSNTFSSVASQQKSAVIPHSTTFKLQPHSRSNTKQDESSIVRVKLDDTEESETEHIEPPDLKIEINDEEEVDVSRGENYQKKYASSDYDPLGDFESDFSTAEPVPESFGNNIIPEPTLQQSNLDTPGSTHPDAVLYEELPLHGRILYQLSNRKDGDGNKKWKYVWSREGRIYCRTEEESFKSPQPMPHTINCVEDLKKLKFTEEEINAIKNPKRT